MRTVTAALALVFIVVSVFAQDPPERPEILTKDGDVIVRTARNGKMIFERSVDEEVSADDLVTNLEAVQDRVSALDTRLVNGEAIRDAGASKSEFLQTNAQASALLDTLKSAATKSDLTFVEQMITYAGNNAQAASDTIDDLSDVLEEVRELNDWIDSNHTQMIDDYVQNTDLLAQITLDLEDRVAQFEASIMQMEKAVADEIKKMEDDLKDIHDDLDAINNDLDTEEINGQSVRNVLNAVIPTVTYFAKQSPYNKNLVKYRWATWHTYGYNQWTMRNNADLFGGIQPSQWVGGSGKWKAHHMDAGNTRCNNNYNTANNGGNTYAAINTKCLLAGLFTNPASTYSKNALVYQNYYSYYSSNDGRFVGALFRIKNTKTTPITWTVKWWFSSYQSWGDWASYTVNGIDPNWNNPGNCHQCEKTADLVIPANRVSTVIFISAASPPQSDTRSTILAFKDNSLELPDGLEYVDDLAHAEPGWNK